MNHPLPRVLLAALTLSALALTGCINPLPGKVKASQSDPAALALLEAAAEAHGGAERFASVQRIDVAYDGDWLNNVWKLQPVLVDRPFRKSSDETITYGDGWPIVTQTHTGPGGTKTVRWDPAADGFAGASVKYNGEPVAEEDERAEVQEAAAMVAEAYRMFLTGPFYFTDRLAREGQIVVWAPQNFDPNLLISPDPDQIERVQSVVVMSEPDTIDGFRVEQLLFRLRPGFGASPEDRVQVAIDSKSNLVRRVRFSLDGFRDTEGATADVVLSGFKAVQGLTFPTQFLEIVTHPIDRAVHRWEAESIEITFDSR
jgi:hypothetical protein